MRSFSLSGNPTFEVRCQPYVRPYSLVSACGFSISVGQRILRDGMERTWDSIMVCCAEEGDGTLTVRVLVTNPDWEDLMQVAEIRSRPNDAGSLTALGCNLDHISVPKA
jgi:hypothetical protein